MMDVNSILDWYQQNSVKYGSLVVLTVAGFKKNQRIPASGMFH